LALPIANGDPPVIRQIANLLRYGVTICRTVSDLLLNAGEPSQSLR
jgi:hypothetical protein